MYHQFLELAAPMGAPHAVRKDMDDWNFATAMKRIDKSREVFDQLTEADKNLPEADLVRIMKPQFEAGRQEASRGGGVVSDPDVWQRTVESVASAA